MKYKQMWVDVFGIFIGFYILPLCMSNVISAIIILFIANPLLCLFRSYHFGKVYGMHFMFPLCILFLCLPSLYIYYNSSALVYAFVYGGISLIATFAGSRKKLMKIEKKS